MALPQRQEEYYTFADVMEWEEQGGTELIDGELSMLSAPTRRHQSVLLALSRQIADYLDDKPCEINIAPFAVRLFERQGDRPEDVDTVVEPDITVVCDPDKLDDWGCKGAPDVIMEILSPATQRRDRIDKFRLYQAAGVREYWIVDPVGKTAQSFVLRNGQFRPVQTGRERDSMRVSVLVGCVIDLSKVFWW